MTLPTGLGEYTDSDLIAELRERGYSVSKNVPEKTIQDILVGYAMNRDYGYMQNDKLKHYTLGGAIVRLRELMNTVQ